MVQPNSCQCCVAVKLSKETWILFNHTWVWWAEESKDNALSHLRATNQSISGIPTTKEGARGLEGSSQSELALVFLSNFTADESTQEGSGEQLLVQGWHNCSFLLWVKNCTRNIPEHTSASHEEQDTLKHSVWAIGAEDKGGCSSTTHLPQLFLGTTPLSSQVCCLCLLQKL